MAIAAVLFWLATVPLSSFPNPNATADVLQRIGPRFGLDFDPNNKDSPHPTGPDRNPSSRTGYGAWLNAELARPDDVISEPPAAFRDYLRERSAELWELVAALEKSPPDWGQRPKDPVWSVPHLLPTLSLERILLAAALCQEHDGDALAASRILEAAWSLGKPVAEGDFLIHQLLAVGILKLQAGALRKIPSPSFAWMGRLSGNASWSRMLDAADREAEPAESGLSEDPFQKALRRLQHAVAAHFRGLSPCGASRETDDDVWRAVAKEVESDPSPVVRSSAEEPPPTPIPSPGVEPAEAPEGRRFYFKDNLATETGAIRRAAKLSVDRELTLKILELRLEAEASKEKRWPETLTESFSHVCPGSSYVYRREGEGMEIRFDEVIDSAGGEPVLPLSFGSRGGARPAPSPAPAPTPTPAPVPANGP